MTEIEGQTRDIDVIIREVHQEMPEVKVVQWTAMRPTDDDGIWWFSLPGVKQWVHVESSYGICPFIVETEERDCENARTAMTVDEAVGMIVEYLIGARGQYP